MTPTHKETPEKQAPRIHQEAEGPADAPAAEAQPQGHPQERVEQASFEKLEAEIAALKDRLLRELAEQENIRMRARRERDEAVKFAASAFAKDLVGSLDNLRRAIESFPNPALREVFTGLEATERGLLKTFERYGITRLDPAGEAFDPSRHEALHHVEDTSRPPGTVADVLEPGYLHHGRLLRPAKVSVSKKSEAESKS